MTPRELTRILALLPASHQDLQIVIWAGNEPYRLTAEHFRRGSDELVFEANRGDELDAEPEQLELLHDPPTTPQPLPRRPRTTPSADVAQLALDAMAGACGGENQDG